MNNVSPITVEGRAELLRVWGPGFDQEGAGGEGGGTGGATQYVVRESYKSFKGIYLTVLERLHQFIMCILQVVHIFTLVVIQNFACCRPVCRTK